MKSTAQRTVLPTFPARVRALFQDRGEIRVAVGLVGVLVAPVLLAACITIVAPSRGPIVDPAVERGADYAAKYCSGCHAIGPTGASVYRAAPPFRDLRAPWDSLSLQLRLSRLVGREHYGMPPRILLPSEAEDLAAFIHNQHLADPSKRMKVQVAPCIGLAWC